MKMYSAHITQVTVQNSSLVSVKMDRSEPQAAVQHAKSYSDVKHMILLSSPCFNISALAAWNVRVTGGETHLWENLP